MTTPPLAAAAPVDEAGTSRLLQLCGGYFASYLATGILVKVFLGPADRGFPAMSDLQFLVYSTGGGTALCLAIVLALGWWRYPPTRWLRWGPISVPAEVPWIVASGVCTAVIVPTTTLLYTLPVPVMVAMVIMRGSVIAISRGVDAVLSWQGISVRPVFWEENVAVGFALGAVAVHLVSSGDGFAFGRSPAAVSILASYVASYAVRIYIMNWFKATRPRGAPTHNTAFFGIEQITASSVLFVAMAVVVAVPSSVPQLATMRSAVLAPHALWLPAIGAGTIYGVVALFSVFLFLFKGRSATFAGLVNRLTSLVAGTTATVVCWLFLGFKPPTALDVASLGLILVAVGFLARAELRRGR